MARVSTCALQNNPIGACAILWQYTCIYTRTHKIFWWKAILWHNPCMFLTSIFMLHPTYMHILKGSLCYLLTNIHILKGIFFAIHIQHFARHFMLYIFIFCKAFHAIYIYILQGISCYIYSTFCKAFHAIYLHIYILLKGFSCYLGARHSSWGRKFKF